MSVYVDGSTLSALLFNHFNSPGIQYGLLLGQHTEEIEDRISDSQIQTANVNAYTTISSFIPWQSTDHVYNRNGTINEDVLDQIIPPGTEQSLVGWYSFRHQTSARPSMKETMLHQSLSKCSRFQGQQRDFYFLLCTSSVQLNGSTHSCNHGCLQFVKDSFSPVPMMVLNLGDTTRKEYRKQSNVTLLHSSTFKGTFKQHRKDVVHSSGEMDQVMKMEALAVSMSKSLMSVYNKMKESEAVVGLLEHDVLQLLLQLEALEKNEIIRTLQDNSNAEKERKEEEVKENNQTMAEEEKADLDKLLMDLGLPVTEEGSSQSQSVQAFSLLEPVPTVCSDQPLNGRESPLNTDPGLEKENIAGKKEETKTVAQDRSKEPFSFVNDVLSKEKESLPPTLKQKQSAPGGSSSSIIKIGVTKPSNSTNGQKAMSNGEEDSPNGKSPPSSGGDEVDGADLLTATVPETLLSSSPTF